MKLIDLVTWLRGQPRETTYDYFSNTDCLLARFYRAQGFEVKLVEGVDWIDKTGKSHAIAAELREAVNWQDGGTYGQVLDYAEAKLNG